MRYPLAPARCPLAACLCLALAAYLFPLAARADDRPVVADRATGAVSAAVSFTNTVAFGQATEMTLVGGELTPTVPVIAAQPQTLTSDDLTTVHAARVGQVLWLTLADPATDVIVVKHGTGNLSLPAGQDITITHGALQLTSLADGTWVATGGGGGGGDGGDLSWGSIGGSLSDQPDLQAALDLKADASSLPSFAALPTTGGTADYVWTANGTTAQWSPVSATNIASTAISFAATETIVGNVGYPYPDEYTVLQLHLDDNLTDYSRYAQVVTYVGMSSAAYSAGKFANAAILLDGISGNAYRVADADSLELSAGDFTIDFWMKQGAEGDAGDYMLVAHQSGTVGGDYWRVYRVGATNAISFVVYDDSSPVVSLSGGTITTTYKHFAVVRSGSTWTLYQDGTSVDSDTASITVPDMGSYIQLGGTLNNGPEPAFYVDEFRISKGIARWTGNFTPPTAAYADDSYEVQEIPLTTGAQALLASPEVSAASTGSLLVKTTEWTPLAPGPAGYTLTSTGPGSVPQWSPVRYAPQWGTWTLDQYNANLVGYWPLSETSGPRYDLARATAFGDHNAVGWTSGVGGSGVAALFTRASSQYLSTGAPKRTATTLFYAAWIKVTSTGINQGIWGGKTAATYAPVWLFVTSANVIEAAAGHEAGATLAYVDGTTSIAAGTWYHVAVWVDSADKLYLYINGAEEGTAASVTAPLADLRELYLGAYYDDGGVVNTLNGAIQHAVLYLDLPFTDTEAGALATALYNGGTPSRME